MSDQESTETPTTSGPTESGEAQGGSQVGTQGDATTATSRPVAGPSQAAPLLMGVKLPIRVLLGRTELCLRDITQLGNGAVVELDCSPDDPVEIIVNDRVIAHGEVVVVNDKFGIRLTSVMSAEERIKKLSAEPHF